MTRAILSLLAWVLLTLAAWTIPAPPAHYPPPTWGCGGLGR